jgi:hypothetical protein
MKEEMIKQMNDKQIVEHYLNGFAEECSNVLLNRQDYDVLVNKCLKMLGEQRLSLECFQKLGGKDCKYKELMGDKAVRFAGSYACSIEAYKERVLNGK